MNMPQRIQRKRTKGWRMPPNTLSVTRPGKHGNPFFPGSGYAMGFVTEEGKLCTPPPTPANCVAWFRKRMETMKREQPDRFEALLAPLRGKDLACWCKPGEPCHADVLLELANVPLKPDDGEL